MNTFLLFLPPVEIRANREVCAEASGTKKNAYKSLNAHLAGDYVILHAFLICYFGTGLQIAREKICRRWKKTWLHDQLLFRQIGVIGFEENTGYKEFNIICFKNTNCSSDSLNNIMGATKQQ